MREKGASLLSFNCLCDMKAKLVASSTALLSCSKTLTRRGLDCFLNKIKKALTGSRSEILASFQAQMALEYNSLLRRRASVSGCCGTPLARQISDEWELTLQGWGQCGQLSCLWTWHSTGGDGAPSHGEGTEH